MADLLSASRGVRGPLFWRLYARWYDTLWDTPLTSAVAARVVALLPAGLPVVELGAGTGLVTRHLVGPTRVVRASEPDRYMRARLRARSLPLAGLTTETIDGCRLPAGDHAVVAVNVLHLVPDASRALARLTALAGPGGRVILVVPAAGATVTRVARAHRSAGASRGHAVLFCLAHAVLGPVALLAGVRTSVAAMPYGPVQVSREHGVQDVYVLDA